MGGGNGQKTFRAREAKLKREGGPKKSDEEKKAAKAKAVKDGAAILCGGASRL